MEPDTFCPLAMLKRGSAHATVTDHLGTPIRMYDLLGRESGTLDFTVYGKKYGEGFRGWMGCPFRYPGQYADAETGLYYNRFRYYDPVAGQYISQDPIGLAGGNPTLYGYVGDTYRESDPFGLARIYEDAPYHGKVDAGRKSRAPFNGQHALDNSYQVKPTSPRRVGYDLANEELVVLDRTAIRPNGDEVFHGHVREFNDLHVDQ